MKTDIFQQKTQTLFDIIFSIFFLIDIMERLIEETENYSISTQEKESAESFAILLFLMGLIFSLLITYNLLFK